MGHSTEKSKGTVCVTGATGFVASWLIKCLLQDGYRVRGAVRDPENYEKAAHLWALSGAKERLQLVKGDLLVEGSYDAAVAGCEGVFHTAAALVRIKSDPKAEMLDPTILGTLNVLHSCAKSTTLKRVVLTSSTAAVRFRDDLEQPGAVTYLDEYSWSSIFFCTKYQIWYSLAKILSEQEAWKFAFLHSIDLVVVLPSFVIGPCLPYPLSKTAQDICDLLNGGRNFGIHGRMGYVHVDDVARAHILVYETPSAQGRYICSAQEATPQELVQYLADRYPHLQISTKKRVSSRENQRKRRHRHLHLMSIRRIVCFRMFDWLFKILNWKTTVQLVFDVVAVPRDDRGRLFTGLRIAPRRLYHLTIHFVQRYCAKT
uniref:NAD-dependent epimerase/dehydratase domain-containing protein n=1 Tax=Physcomitrium patens TaxID=3218 RepID=A0A7I4F6L3_PHYPA